MKHVKHFNQQYSNLCAILGDLTIKHTQITKEIQDITNKINSLQQSQSTIAKIEQELIQESNNEQAASNTSTPS